MTEALDSPVNKEEGSCRPIEGKGSFVC